jgi:N-acetylneuraminic acid mutarotase
MKQPKLHCLYAVIASTILSFASYANEWQLIDSKNKITARHEAGLTHIGNKVYLLGGRGMKHIKPTDVYDTASKQWQQKSPPPVEIHHFQAITYQSNIYFIGAMTGPFPNETPLDTIVIYNTNTDKWSFGDTIPKSRRRGGAGVSIYNNKMYISGGITHGHMTGTVDWFDEYNPATGEWKVLPDMPHGRDHFQSAVINNQLYAAGGRKTSKKTNQIFSLVVDQVNIYDFEQQRWRTSKLPLPTGRAGNTTIAVNNELWVIGGESTQKIAHNNVEIFDTKTQKWHNGPLLKLGRHGTGAALINNTLWTVSGSGNQGGRPELKNMEKLDLE